MSTDSAQTDSTVEPHLIEMRRPLEADMVEHPPGCPFDPAPGLLARRGQGAVQPITLTNGLTVYLVTGFDEGRAVLADSRFSADKFRNRDVTSMQPEEVTALGTTEAERGVCPVVSFDEAPPRTDGYFIFMDPPEHTRLRRLLTGQFTVRRMKLLESRVHEIAAEHIEAMRAAGTEADLVPAYAMPIPSLMICELLGVDYADRDEFQRYTSVSTNVLASDEEKAASAAGQYVFMERLVREKRANPGDDIISGLINVSDPALTDSELVDISLMLLGAGHETTANMLGLGALALLSHPDQLAALRADPALYDNAVEELLRYLSIIQLGVTRIAMEDVTVGGVEIPKGATAMLAAPEANRDPAHFDHPDRLDVTRPRPPHLTFGHGVHQCIGQQLARIEMRIGLEELFTRMPELRLTLPLEEVDVKNEMLLFGVRSLPVTWA
ncbi:cytochrome P450 [Trujillonella endophytica]|uniref:Cytochrome P450 n=1 Tax=Trujillonella endophytica TaxID=673521 RepID=A0A1H8SFI9_9ACTN|nr:cytochrome P450 [Trujillella endophytica]SEO77345.1 Cytochrome P450 [Trujillella endophytica]